MCCQPVRQCLDEIDRFIVNELLRLLGYGCIVDRFPDSIRHIARLSTRPKRNVDGQSLWGLSLVLRYSDNARNLKLLNVNFVRGPMRFVWHAATLPRYNLQQQSFEYPLSFWVQAKRRFAQIAGHLAADPSSGANANDRSSNDLEYVPQHLTGPRRDPSRRSTHK